MSKEGKAGGLVTSGEVGKYSRQQVLAVREPVASDGKKGPKESSVMVVRVFCASLGAE